MSRADSLYQGSWNGIPFLYMDASSAHGQRGPVHEYPGRNTPYFEPLGRKARQYTLDVLCLGDDWQAQRARLIAAFELGKGSLVHPADGPMKAACTDLKRSETVTALGRVDFQVTLVEDSAGVAPPQRDTGSDIDSAGSAASTASQNSFTDDFAYAGQPFTVTSAAQSTLGDVLGAIGDAVGFVAGELGGAVGGAVAWFQYGVSAAGTLVRTALRIPSMIVGAADAVEQQAIGWAGDLASTVNEIGQLGNFPGLAFQIGSLVSGISGLQQTGSGAAFTGWAQQRRAGIATQAIKAASSTDASAGFALVSVGGYSAGAIRSVFAQQLDLATSLARPAPVPGAPAQSTLNADAAYDLARQAALIEAAGAFSAMPFASQSDAFTARDLLTAALDAECNTVEDGTVRRAFAALRIAVIKDARARSQALPAVTHYTLGRSMPAVVLAARLYDDPGMALDIVQRNDVDNPLFLPAGVPLEVIAYG